MKDEVFNFISKIDDIVDEEEILPHLRRLMAEDGVNFNCVNSRGFTPLNFFFVKVSIVVTNASKN